MVCKREGPARGDGEGFASNRVAVFQIVLTAAHLSDVAPGRNDVNVRYERIIHPLTNLMTERVDILNGHVEDSRVTIGCDRVSLCPGIVRAEVTKDAAAARSPERVVVQEKG